MKEVNLVYDFDGTLTSSVMPQYKIIETCGYNAKTFNEYATNNKDKYGFYDGWYMTLIEVLNNKYHKVNNKLISYGSLDVIYNPGVIDYLCNFKLNNINIKHYIITSGIKVYIDNTLVAPFITKTYGTTFKYDNDSIIGIEEISSSTKKVDHIKSINIDNGRSPLDCTNLIYFGDGMTDYDAFEFVKNHNGISILVYPDKEIVNDKLNSVINASFKADYTLDSPLINYIRKTLDN